MSDTHALIPPGTPAIILSRMFVAPRRLVYKAFTDPRHLPKWWGPEGFTNDVERIDVSKGGEWLFTMIGPDGTHFPNRIRYIDIVKHEKIAYFHDTGEDRDDDLPSFTTTITFEKRDQGTLVTMASIFRDEKTRDDIVKWGAVEGGKSTLAKLAHYLTTMETVH